MSDIVDRLRAPERFPPQTLMAEAADEIERLTRIVQDIEIIVGEFGQYPEPADALLAVEQFIRRTRERKP